MRTILTFVLGPVALCAASVTFHNDVEPILRSRCESCHRAGDIAPMPLTSYAEARPWAKSIRAAVLQKKMPPWFADPHFGKFANDRSLTQAEIDTLVAWSDGGAPEGNPVKAAKPPEVAGGWRMGTPDAIVEVAKAFDVPATGTIPYQYILIPTGFTEDKWVRAVEVQPGTKSVVHHIIASARAPRPDAAAPRRGEYSSSLLALFQTAPSERHPRTADPAVEPAQFSNSDLLEVFVPGGRPPVLPPGQARLVKAGSDILLQIHYTAPGKPAQDRTRVAFIFAKDPPAEQVRAGLVFNQRFTIPAKAANQQIEARALVKRDVKLVSMLPHMHLRGADFEYKAYYPSGESEVLLRVPRYDFHWQINYYLSKPKLLPAGTILECVGHYDNSENNASNPDPNVDVHYGPQTWDEMLNGFLEVAVEPGSGNQEIFGPAPKQ